MATTQPVLAGTTLPYPANTDDGDGWLEEFEYRGTSIETATGAQLTKLVNACTADTPSGVTCPDRRVVARARRVAKLHGAVFSRANRPS